MNCAHKPSAYEASPLPTAWEIVQMSGFYSFAGVRTEFGKPCSFTLLQGSHHVTLYGMWCPQVWGGGGCTTYCQSSSAVWGVIRAGVPSADSGMMNEETLQSIGPHLQGLS